jgi:hypothetical protein
MVVRHTAKAGIAILAVLLAALPVMACVRPGVTMTTAERECCKRMPEQCGHSGMAKSHECCQIRTSPNDLHALKTSPFHLNHFFGDLDAEVANLGFASELTPVLAGINPSTTHSPPGPSSVLTTVLRI